MKLRYQPILTNSTADTFRVLELFKIDQTLYIFYVSLSPYLVQIHIIVYCQIKDTFFLHPDRPIKYALFQDDLLVQEIE